MILDLSDKLQKMKAVVFAGKIVGSMFFILGIILLFSEAFTFMEILLTVLFFGCGGVWLGLMYKTGAQMEKDQSKMFDLSGVRDVY